ncbi:unnamed protein product [Peniophora sp. CBMAI 1063]|nr:unnamed protein product [Peniophora sp. CBMAI 1063]
MVQTQKRLTHKAQSRKKAVKNGEAEAKVSRKEATARWNEEIRRTKWVYDQWFKHPPGTQTITRGAAMDWAEPKLKRQELDTLPYEERFASNGGIMKLHDANDVCLLIRKRKKWLDRTIPTERLRPLRAGMGAIAQAGTSEGAAQEMASSVSQNVQPIAQASPTPGDAAA